MRTPEPKKCEHRSCDKPPVTPRYSKRAIQQSGGWCLSGWIYECGCGWTRVEPERTDDHL